MKSRKKALGYLPYHRYNDPNLKRDRASVPTSIPYDYAIRPKSKLDDSNRVVKKGLVGRKKRLAKTMENISRAMLLMDHQFFAKQVDLTGKTIDMGMLD